MSHMHIPDGVLPIWLIIAGWVVTGTILAAVSWRLRRIEYGPQLPILGVMAAFMLVGMTVEIAPIAYHTNLSVLAGIVLGPSLGFLAAFIVNLMLALFGHGGITVVGLNALVVGAESALGYFLFRGVWSLLRGRQRSPAWSTASATVLALLSSTLLMIGIVGLSNIAPASLSSGISERLSFENPFEHGLLSFELGSGEHEEVARPGQDQVDLPAFARLVIALGLLGWILEGALTGAIVGFVYRVRPDLVGIAVRRGPPTVATSVVDAARASGGPGMSQEPADGVEHPLDRVG